MAAVGLNVDAGDTVPENGQSVPATSPSSGQLHFTMPTPLAGGTATIAIRRASDGVASNSMNFSVQPLILSSSASGGYTPGETITLNGAAFLPNASVHFTPSGQAEQAIEAQSIAADGSSRQITVSSATTATAHGQGTASVMVPPDPTAPASAFNGLLPAGAQSARIGPGARGLTLRNVSCTATARDVLLLGPNYYSIQVSTNEAGKTFDALVTHRYDVQTGAAPNVQTTPQMQMAALAGLSLASGEQLLLWGDEILGQVGVSNTGAAKTFKIAASTVDPATGKVTASQTVAGSVAANADFAVAVTD
ncbi:MAG: hypothetical protein ACLQVL_18545 [Terriglobia bacterium]